MGTTDVALPGESPLVASLARTNRALAAAGIVMASATLSTLGMVALAEVSGSGTAVLERGGVAAVLDVGDPVALFPPGPTQGSDGEPDDKEGAPPPPAGDDGEHR
ncbi:MAG: hypothetical protein M3N37_08490, partial [Actinomycetota bacterium]|nr:hypothetical protein [Actinomycetota bacterium]